MFTQSAYKDPMTMKVQLKAYIEGLAQNNNWPQNYTAEVLNLINVSYDENYSIFKFNTTIIKDFIQTFINKFQDYTIIFTRDNVDIIPKYQKVLNVLSELIGTTHFIKETESITNIVEEQAIEAAQDLQKKSDDTFERFIPYIGLGVVAYFVLPRVIREYQK